MRDYGFGGSVDHNQSRKPYMCPGRAGWERYVDTSQLRSRFVFDLIVFITCLNYLFDVLLSQPSGLSGFYLKAEQHVFY